MFSLLIQNGVWCNLPFTTRGRNVAYQAISAVTVDLTNVRMTGIANKCCLSKTKFCLLLCHLINKRKKCCPWINLPLEIQPLRFCIIYSRLYCIVLHGETITVLIAEFSQLQNSSTWLIRSFPSVWWVFSLKLSWFTAKVSFLVAHLLDYASLLIVTLVQ